MAEGCVIRSFVRNMLDIFWAETLWLPPHIRWSDFNPKEVDALPETKDLAVLLPLTTCALIVRYLLEKCVFNPLGLALTVDDNKSKRKVVANELLENAYRKNGKIKQQRMAVLAKQLDWSERKVATWFRRRCVQDKSDLKKFSESSWKWLYYTYSFTYGLICLWDKPWLWDIKQCWTDYPRQSVHSECWWYYMSSMTFYVSLLLSHYYDVRRKDFWQMFLHHVVTIALLALSWVCNLLRIGTLILLIHDFADCLLEAAKMAKYTNCQRLCNVLFVIFTLSWIVTRLGIYPLWLLYHTTMYSSDILNWVPSYIFFNSMLYCLLGLHIYWTFVIVKIAMRFMEVGEAEDLRSSSSELESSDDSEELKEEKKLYSITKST